MMKVYTVIKMLKPAWVAFLLVASLANAGEVVEVSILKMEFIPKHVIIKPGTTVKWVNNEKRNNHSIYFENESLPESERFFPGESWQRTFEKSGVYPYRCGPHPEMTGVVEVAK
jgi:plastocyanin